MERSLEVLNVRLVVASDTPALVEPFFGVFGRDAGSAPAPGDGREVRVRVDDAAGRYQDGSRQVRLAPGRLRSVHVYNLLYTTLVRALSDVYLLHAAAVARGGRARVISGPAGSGKTSLGRALLARGFDLIGDDLAPLAVQDGRIHPFPRRIGLSAGNGSAPRPVPDDAVRLGDKLYVSVESIGARPAAGPLPLAGVVIMNPYRDAEAGPVQLTVGLVGDATPFCRPLESLPGVRVRRHDAVDGVEVAELRLRGAEAIAAATREVARADSSILFHARGYGADKVYAERPALVSIPVREAAVALLRETLNREPASALMRRHHGQLAPALVELAGLLSGVPCFRLAAAGVETTADLLAQQLP